MELNQTTFAGNISGFGSVIALHSSVVTIKNSIFWSNEGPIVYSPESSGVTYLEANYSNIEGGQEYFSQFSNIIFSTEGGVINQDPACLLYTSPSPRDLSTSRMPSSA